MVLSKKVIEIDSGRKPVRHPAAHPLGDLPDVPVLPETLLMMEFCAQRQATNLHELAEIVLGDLGAAIQTMHKAGQECMLRNARPTELRITSRHLACRDAWERRRGASLREG